MTEHAAALTLGLSCGCQVYVKEGETVGRALEYCATGEMLRIGRDCPLHGSSEVYAIVDNRAGGILYPT